MPMRSDERLAQKIATDILPRYPANSILDIGCGDGVVNEYLSEDTNYFGLDITDACIYEQKHANQKVRYVEASNIPGIVRSEGAWDTILLLDVIEHTRDFTGLFKEALRSANKYVVVSLPNELFVIERLRMLLGRELNAHSLDLIKQPEGFKHQFIINTQKARLILQNAAEELGFSLAEEIVRPLVTKRKWQQPAFNILGLLYNDQVWSQGSIFVFNKSNSD
jgi:2-polyprenyl-3-methyl-5-hydroxy-6-metoxy-1,4-benzoquinol methylase